MPARPVWTWACLIAALYFYVHVWLRREDDQPGVRSVVRPIRRLKDVRGFLQERQHNAWASMIPAEAWQDTEAVWPDVTDRHTLKMLARLSCWAYYEHVPATITDAPGWQWSSKFGWDVDGLRGHIFAKANNASILVALKGTSASVLPGGKTAQQDKDNDNLLFSCCCARVSPSW